MHLVRCSLSNNLAALGTSQDKLVVSGVRMLTSARWLAGLGLGADPKPLHRPPGCDCQSEGHRDPPC